MGVQMAESAIHPAEDFLRFSRKTMLAMLVVRLTLGLITLIALFLMFEGE